MTCNYLPANFAEPLTPGQPETPAPAPFLPFLAIVRVARTKFVCSLRIPECEKCRRSAKRQRGSREWFMAVAI